MTKLDEYLRMRAAAECRGVCRSTLCSWKVASKIPIRRHPLNRYKLFKISDLDKLLKATERAGRIRRPG